MMEIDHDSHQVHFEQMRTTDEALDVLIPNEESVSQRLTTPIVTTYVDTEKISFERYENINCYQLIPCLFIEIRLGCGAGVQIKLKRLIILNVKYLVPQMLN